MASFIDRFKNRQVLSPILSVELEGVTFRVERFSEAERETARIATRAALRLEGIDPDVATNEQRGAVFFRCLADVVRKHIKSWVKDGAESSDPTVLNGWFDEMSGTDKMRLGFAFHAAEVADEQSKNELAQSGASSSAKDLGTNSLNQS